MVRCAPNIRGGSLHGTFCHLGLGTTPLPPTENGRRWRCVPWGRGAVVVAAVNLKVLKSVVAVGSLLGEDPLDLISGCCAEPEMCPFLVRAPNGLL